MMKTTVVKIDPGKPDLAKIRHAAKLIDSGKLVAFPTETVYGIACGLKKDYLAKLDRIKGRVSAKYYTLHISQKSDLAKYVPSAGLRAEKLIEKAWPGPVTIVFELSDDDINQQRDCFDKELFENLYKNNSVGVRCPDNNVALALLGLTKQPVVAPSANVAGQKPAENAEQVLSQLSGQIELVLDGGSCKYKMSSTVVKFGQNGLEILRPGVYSQEQLNSLSKVQFLFVCTGNICRSPMAEGMFRKYLSEKLGCEVDQLEEKGYKIVSAGTLELAGSPVSSEAIVSCAARDVNIKTYSSTGLSQELIEQSDLIFAMSRAHLERVVALSPKTVNRCQLLAAEKDVPDPIGQSQEVYDSCAEMIENAVKKKISELDL